MQYIARTCLRNEKMATILNLWIYEEEGLYYLYVAKAKALISCMVTVQLNCSFVFAYAYANANSKFSHDAAQLIKFKEREGESKIYIKY